jgi:multidrug efflux pump subunit AcrA (membrane-fusion protein)
VTTAQALVNAAQAAATATNAQDAATVAADQQQLAADQQRFANDGCNTVPQPNPTTCSNDQAAIDADQRALSAARAQQQRDLSFGQNQVQVAQVQLASAQANLNAQGVADPAAVASAVSQVAAAQAQVARATANLAQTVLTAPVAGTVLAVNAQVGELVGNGAATNPTLGSGAPQPGTNPGGSTTSKAFALIGDSSSLQVAAPFAETDVARLAAGQSGQLTVDALAGLTVPCHLIGLAQGSTVAGGVVQYFGTIGLDSSDPRLRLGMTVNVDINVARADNVLAVPNQALYLLDGHMHVDVWFQARSVATSVTTGLVGAQLTQITSGLGDGQQVLLSAPHGLPSPSPTG